LGDRPEGGDPVERSITIYGLNNAFESESMDIPDFLTFAAEAGVEAVDVGYYWQNERDELKLLPQWARENGLKLGTYICRNDFNSPEPAEIERQCDIIRHAIDNAAALGIKYVRIFIAWFIFEKTYWDIKEWLIPALKEVTGYAEKEGIVLAIENHGYIGGASEELLDILREVGSMTLRILLDIGNFLLVGEDPLEGIRALLPYTVHVHIKDFRVCSPDETQEGLLSKDGKRIVPAIVGEGDLDLEGSIKLLHEASYEGYLSIECEAPGDARKNTITSLQAVDSILAKLSNN
jgi:sugar phosphate isomerase/epimerase